MIVSVQYGASSAAQFRDCGRGIAFGKAAARLGVVQPAVSQQVARLERELGVSLLKRSSRRVTLTSEGNVLLTEARAVLAAVDRVRDLADGLGRGRVGVVRLGTSRGLGDRLSRGLTALRALEPRVELVLIEGTGQAHAAAIAAGDLDAALVRGELEAPRVRATRLGEDSHSVVLPAEHPAAASDTVRIEDMTDLRLRLPPRDSDPSLHDAVHARCAGDDVLVRQGRDVTSTEDTVLEIGTGAAAWTVIPDALLGITSWEHLSGVAIRSLDPPLCLPVRLLFPARTIAPYTQALLDAFRPGHVRI